MRLLKMTLILAAFLSIAISPPVLAWSWNSGDNVLPSLREELDKEIAAYRQQVGNGISIQERILILDRLIGNYKPLGMNVSELEAEQSRLLLQDKQAQLRSAEAQDEAMLLYERGVAEYRDGQYRMSVETFRSAERKLPDDEGIKEIRRKLESITPILEAELAQDTGGQLIRLGMVRFLENDPKRALNALIYAKEKKVDRPDLVRLKMLVQNTHPEIEPPKLTPGISLIDYKLQSTLEAIYDGRYLTAIAECTDVLDLEPENVLALTRLGSAYYAMNERDKARKVWTKALQLDPNNQVLKKFLYSSKRTVQFEKN